MKLWPFSKRGTRVDTDELLPPLDLINLDYTAFGSNDACIKLWCLKN